MKLSTSDYKKILKFYKLSIPKKSINIKKKADKIIAKKFCSCIKKVQQKFKKEGIAIGICTKSVITRKGYKRGKFKCKKRRTIKLQKGGKRKKKTRKKRGGKTTVLGFPLPIFDLWQAKVKVNNTRKEVKQWKEFIEKKTKGGRRKKRTRRR